MFNPFKWLFNLFVTETIQFPIKHAYVKISVKDADEQDKKELLLIDAFHYQEVRGLLIVGYFLLEQLTDDDICQFIHQTYADRFNGTLCVEIATEENTPPNMYVFLHTGTGGRPQVVIKDGRLWTDFQYMSFDGHYWATIPVE